MNINVGGQEYEILKMSALDQLYLVRKLSPAIPIIEGLIADRNDGKDKSLLAALLMSRLSDEDANAVMLKCLNFVNRKQESGWAKVSINGNIMFSDIGLSEMLQLSMEVVMENVGNFFKDALASLEAAAKA